ncbi:MAG: BON domain-containing protein [Blastocatellia bacterium]
MRRSPLILLAVVVLVGVVIWIAMSRTRLPEAAQGVMQQAADLTTTGKVKSNFSLSKRLSIYDLKVATQNGVVTLTGRVPTEIDKELAASVAKDTTGVTGVTNQLVVESGLRPSEQSLRETARIADLEIQADLRERYASSPELSGENIQITIKDRNVTLSGEVTSPQQKAGAEQVARSINNIQNVTNMLAVKDVTAGRNETPGVSSDSSQRLGKQVQFALFNERDNFVEVGAINVDTKDGIVTLSGNVSSKAERALAERITRDVNGVQTIRNQLTPWR